MPHPTYEIWSRRSDALSSTLTQTIQQMQQNPTSIERKPTLLALLACLQKFGQGQFDFFRQGFDNSNLANRSAVRLEPSTSYPPEYAMRATIDQIAYDLDVIQRAYQQRLPELATPEMRETLAKADILAYQALLPAIEQGLIENTTVVTYFQKSVKVRIVPYAPVAFVGLPLSALTVSRDLLAIPHEVGHYLYRMGKTQHGEFAGSRFTALFDHALQALPAWCRAWAEEIFADVYGALVGGPVMALGFEDLVTDDPIADFTRDDGEHPIAALRPEIFRYVYEQRGVEKTVTEQLAARWQNWLTKRGNPTSFTAVGGEEPETVCIKEARAHLYSAIDAILASDLMALPANPAHAIDDATLADVTAFFQRFDDQVADLSVQTDNQVPEVTLSPDDAGNPCCIQLAPLRGTNLAPVTRPVGQTGLWIDAIKEASKAGGQGFNMPPAVWMALLDGSGWATETGGINFH